MDVIFHKTSNKTYSVEVRRPGLPTLRMDKAPGFDQLVPHDMQHFLVEQALGLKLGVFGQIAAGGTAATFFPEKQQATDSKTKKRQNRKLRSRGKDLLAQGKQDGAISERATYVCMYNWLKSSTNKEESARSKEMQDIAHSIISGMEPKEQKLYSAQMIDRMNANFQSASDRWVSLAVNDGMKFDWQ